MVRINFSVIISILIIILLTAFILGYNLFGLGTLVNKGFSAINQVSSNAKNEANVVVCPNEIIPRQINLTDSLEIGAIGDTNFGQEVYRPIGYWADGQIMEILNYSSYPMNLCHRGSSEGENINLVYCNRLSYSKSTTPISKDGVIGKTEKITYSINLVLQNESEMTVFQKHPMGDILSTEKLYTYRIISSECIKQ